MPVFPGWRCAYPGLTRTTPSGYRPPRRAFTLVEMMVSMALVIFIMVLLSQAFVASMLMYSVPMLAEERLSPQLHNWVYGYSPFSFIEHVRWNGYRPVVFLPQGLQLALFVAGSVPELFQVA